MPRRTQVNEIQAGRNAQDAYKRYKAKLSKDAEAESKKLEEAIKAYEVANSEQEAARTALKNATVRLNEAVREVRRRRVKLAKYAELALEDDAAVREFRNDK